MVAASRCYSTLYYGPIGWCVRLGEDRLVTTDP